MSDFIPVVIGFTAYFLTKMIITKRKHKKGICKLSDIGFVKFSRISDTTCRIECSLKDISPGLHGLHVHEFGDLSNGCESTCSHYNPYNLEHGGARGKNRHQGDFGNVEANEDGICSTSKIVDVNLDEIIGRALILHEDEDDLGKQSNKQSKITGNAGKKIACGVIGIAHK
tara:strand:+ start:2323 stop:2835 length:513 start_codon:yes stop_codon:yes gene_type:complete